MRSWIIHRCTLMAGAAITALALTVSAVPAQAQSTAPASAGIAAHHGPASLAPGATATGVRLCLNSDGDYCVGTNFDPVVGDILVNMKDVGYGVLTALIVIWLKNKAKGSSFQAEVVGYDPENHGWPTTDCLGAWGYNAKPHLGSCSSHHGIYWGVNCLDKNCTYFHLWNTYSKGYLTTGTKPANGGDLWIHTLKAGYWQTWGDFD